ncbi:hypothetical protein K469DRAFT_726732 [Zopfia rhizophila CBS 207.26]|uniref:Uncharacterized protein n=1 Tax=Zopfia rhizophila CBS 207.26 TaxID=1314779 RepID=A0A6A6E713_9PEZI|nr:hypothetical protein K469DRAFT_726732 [Zopfia rhizophila CBS 207.26]
MKSCCRTCDHRNHDLSTPPISPTLIDVCLITLRFKSTISAFNPTIYTPLNTFLNNITDSAESTSHPSSFTSWSPSLDDSKTAIILTTASEACSSSTSPIFEPITRHLATPPTVQHIFLDYSILSLAASSPDEKIPCDIILLSAPNPSVAGAIGKRFGWDPRRSSLSAHMEISAPARFSRPGDLVRDFWAWAELTGPDPTSPSSSLNSEADGVLKSTNSDEKNMGFYDESFAGEEGMGKMEDEMLVMLFQWSSHADGERFKHPLQKSVGLNEQPVGKDLWDRHVAHPLRQMEGIGAKVESFKVELRGVEERIDIGKGRERSGSKRLSVMATGLGEKVSGLWK